MGWLVNQRHGKLKRDLKGHILWEHDGYFAGTEVDYLLCK
jgi:hypothetical protein